MPQVKVWNDSVHPHEEMYKGEKIRIEPKSYIEMDFEEALQFAGQFTPRIVGSDDRDDPRGFKMIRVEKPTQPIIKDDSLVCHANGKRAATPEELKELLTQFSHMRTVDDEAEKAAQADSALLARIEALTAKVNALESEKAGKRGPGRPKKEAAG